MIKSIFSSVDVEDTRGAICIGIDLNKEEYPYSVLATKKENKLIEDIFYN